MAAVFYWFRVLEFDRWNIFGLGAPDIVEKFRSFDAHLENVIHGFFSGFQRRHDVILQPEIVRSSFSFRDFGLFHCGGFRAVVLIFVLEQSDSVTNSMSDFLVGQNIAEFVPSFRFAV